MRFGVALESFTPPGKNPRVDLIYETAKLAESLGFDSVWVWDHLLLGSRNVFPVLDSLTTLAAIGAKTKSIKLGTSVLILALRNPVVLAKVLSTIQYMTQGRLIVGAGVGWYRREFAATGTAFEKRGRIFEERFKLVRRLLVESDLSYDSEGFSLSHASMEPKPAQPIPMLSGGYSDSVLSRAGKIADGWIGYYYPPKEFQQSWNKVINSAKESGRDVATLRAVNIVPLAIAENFDEGDKIVREFTTKYMDLPNNNASSPESGVRGTVDECISQIESYKKAGVQDLVFIPCFYDRRHVETAGKEILPAFA